jgi:hypothetical protein
MAWTASTGHRAGFRDARGIDDADDAPPPGIFRLPVCQCSAERWLPPRPVALSANDLVDRELNYPAEQVPGRGVDDSRLAPAQVMTEAEALSIQFESFSLLRGSSRTPLL